MTPIRPLPRDAHGCPQVPSEEFSPAFLLARILEGNDSSLGLSRSVGTTGLRASLSTLPEAQRRNLTAACGGYLESFLSLSRETNPELFFGSLLRIARNLETEERYEIAGRIYMTVAAFNHEPGCSAARRHLAEHAQARLDFLGGGGTWRDYGELFLRQSIDPSDLIAFGAAGITSRTLRFAALGRILRVREGFTILRYAPWWTRGPAPRLIAGMVGVSIEAPTFVVASHVSQNLLGRSHDWEGDALDQELRDAYLFFGPVRALASAASLLARSRMGLASMRGASIRQRLLHEGAVQIGILGGLLLAHEAQAEPGSEHPSPVSATSLSDEARLYLQFNAMRAPAAGFIRPPRVLGP